jgi:hypothetical protein
LAGREALISLSSVAMDNHGMIDQDMEKQGGTASSMERLTESFAGMLIGDAINSLQRHEAEQSERSRRELIRSIFAAIEGYVWLYREHTAETARDMGSLEFSEEIVLSETSFQVSDQGKIRSQSKHVSTLRLFRLTTRIAERLEPALDIRFDTGHWEQLVSAMEIRNRLVHPKSQADLRLSDDDVAKSLDAFYWLLDTITGAMEAMNAVNRKYLSEIQQIFDLLKSGDPDMMATYETAMKNLTS